MGSLEPKNHCVYNDAKMSTLTRSYLNQSIGGKQHVVYQLAGLRSNYVGNFRGRTGGEVDQMDHLPDGFSRQQHQQLFERLGTGLVFRFVSAQILPQFGTLLHGQPRIGGDQLGCVENHVYGFGTLLLQGAQLLAGAEREPTLQLARDLLATVDRLNYVRLVRIVGLRLSGSGTLQWKYGMLNRIREKK